jgi:hypothetical protein
MPTFSALLSTALLVATAIVFRSTQSIGNICAILVTATCVVSGWLFVAGAQVAMGRIHGLIMIAIGCFGIYDGGRILSDRSILGSSGPGANPVAGVIYGYGFVAAVLGAVALLCGVFVIGKTFNASPGNSNGT